MPRVVLWGVVVCLAIASFAGAGVPSAKPIAWIVSLKGGLDHAAQVRELEDQLRQAKAGGARLVCVELSSRSWRLDVVQALAELLAHSELPAMAFVKSEGGTTGLGLLIGASRAAEGCWVEAGRPLTLIPGDNARELASDPKSAKKAESEWVKAAGDSPFETFGALRGAMIDPKAGCWMSISPGGGVMVYPGEPTSEERLQAQRVAVFGAKGGSQLTLDGSDAVALRLCRACAPSAQAAVEAALGGSAKPDIREVRSVGLPLQERSALVRALVEKAEESLTQAESALKAKDPDTAAQTKRARAFLRTAREDTNKAAAAVQDVPEIMKTPAPGAIETGQSPGEHEARWKRSLQRLADRAAKIEAKIDARH